jgi:HlyD family secretion protein
MTENLSQETNPFHFKITAMKLIMYLPALCLLWMSCQNTASPYDATGTFEADETVISAQANGELTNFTVEDGQQLRAGEAVGYIDSTQIFLKKLELQRQVGAILSKTPQATIQLATLQEQLARDLHEQDRVNRLHRSGAATDKQWDDIQFKVKIDEKNIAALQSSLHVTTSSLRKSTSPVAMEIARLEDQLAKCRIINPINGTVLTSYAEPHEMAQVGRPLYRIADLSELILRAYITGDQFAQLSLNKPVAVRVDDGKGGYKEYPGRIAWISSKAEFTPKTIQTKQERAQLVYAVKIRVKNDGYLKIGMYGEVKW